MRVAWLLLHPLLPLAFVVAAANAQQHPSLPVVGQLGGPTNAVAAASDLVAVASGYRITLYDASNPGLLVELAATAPFDDVVRSICIVERRAYVAAGSAGFHIIDLTDSTNPSTIGTWDSPGSAEGVFVSGAYAYVADGPFGLRVLDLSNPASPQPLASAFDDSFVFDVTVAGTVALLAAGGRGVLFVDVTNPRAPVDLAVADTPGSARAIAVRGTQVAVADQWGGVRFLDFANPRSPAEIAGLTTDSWAMDVAVTESMAWIATGSAGLVAIDWTNPVAPRHAATLPLPEADAVGVAAIGSRVSVAAGRGGLAFVDTTVPASMRLLQTLKTLGDGTGIAAASPHVLVAGLSGFTVVDASIAARPSLISSATVGSTFLSYVATASGYAYLGANGKVTTFDLTDPSRPVETSQVSSLVGAFRGMAIRDNLLLAATETDLAILDIKDKARPVLLSRVLKSGPGYLNLVVGVAVTERYAYVAHAEAGMAIVDLSNPAAPVLIGNYGANDPCGLAAIAASETHAYLPWCGRLDVVSVADPRNPQVVASVEFQGYAYRAALVGSTLYLAAASDGVYEIDVSNPAAPAILSRTILPGFASEVAVSDQWIAVAVRKFGLFLLEKRGSATPLRPGAMSARSRSVTAESTPNQIAMRPDAALESPSGVVPMSDRQVVIKSAADSGPGSLREVVTSSLNGDVITFDPLVFPPSLPVSILPLTTLPCVRKNVTIDASNAGVILDGSMLPELHGPSNGLSVCGAAKVKGLQIINFPGAGIVLFGTDAVIGGDRRRGSGPVGEGNLVCGNRDAGMNVDEARRNRIVGNLIGLPPSASTLRYQQRHGLFVTGASQNIIGGTSEADRNVIAGNVFDVGLGRSGQNSVIGNFIGTDITGTRVASNELGNSSQIGVGLESGAHDNLIADNVIGSSQAVSIADIGSHYNRIVRNRIGIGPTGTHISGDLGSYVVGIGVNESYNLVAENVISGLSPLVAAIQVAAPFDVYVIGNRVGTDPGGTIAVPNDGRGILLAGTRRSFIGGSDPADANVIAANNGHGIEFERSGNEQNFIIGNIIGATAYGSALGNSGAGVGIRSAQHNVVQRNTIRSNQYGLESSNASKNTIRRNSIFGNAKEGIMEWSGLLPAAPVLSEVGLDFVKGSACSGCLVEVFADEDNEGRYFEGEVRASDEGQFTFNFTRTFSGPRVTATATDAAGSTSRFSAPILTPPRPRRRSVRH